MSLNSVLPPNSTASPSIDTINRCFASIFCYKCKGTHFIPILHKHNIKQGNDKLHCPPLPLYISTKLSNHTKLLMISSSIDCDCIPTTRHTGSPFLKIISVGTVCTLYLNDSSSFLSTSIFRKFIFSPYFRSNLSTTGDITRHGPHQIAKKSTNKGFSLSFIS